MPNNIHALIRDWEPGDWPALKTILHLIHEPSMAQPVDDDADTDQPVNSNPEVK